MIVLRFQDYGIVLRIIPFEEAKYIITVLTKQNGVYQGVTDQSIPVWTHIHGHWISRTQKLGYWSWEEMACRHGDNHHMLLTLQTLSSLLCYVLPARHPYPSIYEGLINYRSETQFVDLLFLILQEVGYGVAIPEQEDRNEKIDFAFRLFEKHCGWKGRFF